MQTDFTYFFCFSENSFLSFVFFFFFFCGGGWELILMVMAYRNVRNKTWK